MKLMKTTLLRRHRSDPTPCGATKKTAVSDSMTLDLARNDALPALRVLHESPQLHQSVKSVKVHAESCVWYGEIKLDLLALVEAFQLISELPRLQDVTIDLSDLDVPVAALTALLKGAKGLRELHLLHIHIVGPTRTLDEALRAHQRLHHVRFLQCTGTAIQSFMTQLPSLKKLELRHSAVGRVTANNSRSPWVVLGRSTTLQSLTMQELPDLQTDDALSFVAALSEQQLEGTSQLHELHMTSESCDVNGQQVGHAMEDLFLLHTQRTTLKTLTLKFGRTWPTAGVTVASILRTKPGLTSLCVELTGREAMSVQGTAILQVLRTNTTLKRLKFCLDRDMRLDDPLDDCFQTTLTDMVLNHNHVLQSLVILDENRAKYPLTKAVAHKLELNGSKLPGLLHCSSSKKTPEQQQRNYLNAMIDSKDNLNAVFYALSNQPNLLLDISPSTFGSSSSSAIIIDSDSDDDSTSHWGKPVRSKKGASSKAIKQKLKDLFSV